MMSEENPPPLPPRSIIRQHIPGHTDHASALQQTELQLWQHVPLSQTQPAAGVQAVPVGLGFANRPQQQLWQDHASPYPQRGWQPLPQPQTQQSPHESQEINPQVVRSQNQAWPAGEMNQLQLQQLQQLIWLQQHPQLQQQQQLQPQHQPEPSLHHPDPIGQLHEEQPHDKFTKSPSPQIEESRHSPSVNRPFVQNVTSPQQQLWQHHQTQVVHQYEMPHSDSSHSQAFQHTPAVSHQQPLFTQQQYVQPVWQHQPYSQVQMQHIRQSSPQLQQHLIWQQQQQQQLHQHQLQQQQQHNSDPPPPYSPPVSNHFADKHLNMERKEAVETKNDTSNLFNNNRVSHDPMINRNDRMKPLETSASITGNTMGLTPSAPTMTNSMMNQSNNNFTTGPVRILSKSNQNDFSNNETLGSQHTPKPIEPSTNVPSIPTPSQNFNQKPMQGGLFNTNNSNTLQPRPQNFNPQPSTSPYQNLNPPANKGPFGLYGNQNRYPTPASRDTNFNPPPTSANQFRPRSPRITHQQPVGNMFQRNMHIHPQVSNMNRLEHVEVSLYVQGLNPRTSGESIQNFFESIGRPVEVKNDSIIFGIDHTEALVTFLQKPDFFKLKRTVRERKLDGFTLDICEVPAPRAIVVSSDVQVRSKEALMLYFEREQIGGGPLKKNGMDETEDGCCILEFEDPRVVQRLCVRQVRPHRVDGVLLRVSPYYQCDNGVIWDTSLHLVPVPKPVNIQILPDQLEFVRNHCQPQFAARLRDKNADVSFSKDHVTVRCLLKQTMNNYRSLVRTWETSVQEVVAKFLGERIDQMDIEIPDPIWEKMLEWISPGPGKQEFRDILTKPNRERRRIKFIGFKGALKDPQQKTVQKMETLTRAARRKTETRKVKSVEKLSVLEIQGTFPAICHEYKDMKINVIGNEVKIEGDPDEIPCAYIKIYNECDEIEPVVFKHNKCREFVQFVKDESTRRYIQQKMNQKRVKGSWTINGTEINTFAPKGGNCEAIKNVILDSVSESSIEVEKPSLSLLHLDIWGDLLKDKRKRYKDKIMIFTKHQQTVMVIGTDDIAGGVVKQIKDFLDENTEKTVTVPCEPVVIEFIQEHWTNEDDIEEILKCGVVLKFKPTGLELTGVSGKLVSGKEKLMMKLKRMCSKKHKFSQTGVYGVIEHAKHVGTLKSIEKNCRCLIKLPQELESSTLVLEDEDVRPDQVEGETAANSGPRVFETKSHKIAVRLVQGEIGAQKADIIVCSASSKLNLKSGCASYSLVKHGGGSLQTECEKRFPDGVKDGSLAVIGSGTLKCEKVYLTALPAWKEACANGGKVLKNFMRECLRQADKHSKRSLAINAMGTGAYLGYPKDVAANIMYSAVMEFDKSYSKTSVKEISFVLYGKDTDTIRAYEDQERSRVFGRSVRGALSNDFVNGRIKIELVTDDLSKQKVDALLCSVSTDMNLTRSAICKSLVQNGGNSIQDECWKQHGKELGVGKVVDVQAGKLPSKTIFLTVLPTFSATGEESMKTIVQTVLELASTKGYQSLAIPALGTGYLNYPKPTAAKCMYSAVMDWVNKNPKTSLKLIKFVMYSKDTEAQMAWQDCHLKTQGMEARACRNFHGDGTIRQSLGTDGKYKMVQDGCVVGPVQLNVVVGDLLDNDANAIVNGVGNNFDMTGAVAKALVSKCPNILPECQQKAANLKRSGVVMTGASGLKTTYVIHVLFQDTLTNWRTKMVACLEEANKKLIKSVAFPVIGAGSGQKSFTPDSIAECLFMAIDDFAGKVAQPSVTEVRLVIHSSNTGDKQAIMSALQGKTIATINQTSVGKWIRSGIGKLADFCGLNANKGLQVTAPMRQKLKTEMSTVQVVVHSDAIIKINECIEKLEDYIGMEYKKNTVDVDQTVVKSLTDTQADNIVDPGIVVDVKFDRKAGKFHISGPVKNVMAATHCINNKIRQMEREKDNKAAAETLYSQVRWHYEDVTPTETVEKQYGMYPNFVIETAFKDGKRSVELTDTSGNTYVIDFNKLEEYPKHNQSDVVKVIRKDILKGAQIQLPKGWMNMSKNENVKKVALNTSDPEYQKIEKLFISQVSTGPYASKNVNSKNVKVTRIERIQNRTLYQQYAAKKALMEQQQKSSGKQIERQAWHGTKENVITSIISNGFNRSYCGTNAGVYYGQGVYFAADASYSAQSYLTGSKAGTLTKRYMFVVKVLGAEFIKGNSDMRFLPPINPAQPLVLYDCAVDNTQNPMEFVVFHDTQAYPEYLVTFNG